MKKIIADFDYAEITYNSLYKTGMIVWKRKTTTEEYQNGFEVLIECSKTHPIENFLSDIRNQGVVSPETRKWFETVMIPKAIDHGLKRAATIFDGNVFKKYYINLIIQATNKFGMPLKLFNTEEEALEWFKSFNK